MILAGTGKTFTLNAIAAAVRLHQFRDSMSVVLTVASTGLTAILLHHGRTFHSRFNAPLNITQGQVFDIKKQSALATLMRIAKLIIWDEAGMSCRYYLEALDSTLRDICNSHEPFAKKSRFISC